MTWTPLPQEFWQGHKYRYELTFYKIAVGGVKFWPFSQVQSQVFTTNYTDTSFKFTTAETFAMYEIEVRAQTVVGDGPLSARIRAGWWLIYEIFTFARYLKNWGIFH